jgi:hypothetical protein
MPAAKDNNLLTGHWTKQQLEDKAKAKASVTPAIKLQPSSLIKSNTLYYARWKETLKLYTGTEILNALDIGLLERYIIECVELERLYAVREEHYADKECLEWVQLCLQINNRIDGKIKLLQTLALSLYMTPRARAGAVPNTPDKEPKDKLKDLFDE